MAPFGSCVLVWPYASENSMLSPECHPERDGVNAAHFATQGGGGHGPARSLTERRGGDMFNISNKCPARFGIRGPNPGCQEASMAQQSPKHTGDSIAEALERRQREGRPVRIGLIGAGQMGTDIIVQTDLMTGIEVVAAADAVPENVFTARAIAGNGARAPELADDPAATARAIARGRLAVCKSYRSVCMADGVDVIIDATGNPNVGAQVALCAIAAGKHMVMMNVEADVTIGPYLSA